jgi:hypothetical protein
LSIDMGAAVLGIAVIFPSVFVYKSFPDLKRLLFCLLLLLPLGAEALERVTAFHSDIRIAPSGELTVTETIEVQAEGKEIRRGIVREFPGDYRDGFGNRVMLPLQVVKVVRNRQPEHYAIERVANGMRIRIGEANGMLPGGKHVYEITYRSARQIGYFDDHDELYWNVNGHGWNFAFDRLTAEVTFQSPVPAADIKVEAYTGAPGAKGPDYNAFVRQGSVAFRASRPLGPREGMTIVVGFPKGVVAAPGVFGRVQWLVLANPGPSSGIGAFVLMLGFLFWKWWRYEPPPGLGPAGVRFLDRNGFDARCFSAALLGLGSRGYLRVRQSGERYRVERIDGASLDWHPGEQELVRRLLPGDSAHIDIQKVHDRSVQEACAGLAAQLEQYFGRRYWTTNRSAALAGGAIGALGVLAMIVLDTPPSAMTAIMALMVAALLVFALRLLPVYSPQGRKLQDEIDSLRQYLPVAETTPAEFSRFLPYAVALGVEKTWAERFSALLGADGVAAAVSEYYCGSEEMSDFTESVAGLDDTISAAATPPAAAPAGEPETA